MIDGRFALAFVAGLIAVVNPCGFAMLPAYLSYFLGVESHRVASGSPRASLSRAVVVSLAVSGGFLVVFTLLGTVIRAGGDVVAEWAKYVGIVIGAGLVALGLAMLLGYRLPFTAPTLDRGGTDRTVRSMFVFGVSYAIASLGCTIGPFVAIVLGSFTREGTISGVLSIVAYGAGMALLLSALAVTMALARDGLLRGLRRAQRQIDVAAAALMILAGLYLSYFWIYDLASDGGLQDTAGGGLSAWFQERALAVQGWLQERGPWVLAAVLGGVIAAAALAASRRPARREAPPA